MLRICLCAAIIVSAVSTIHAAQVPTYDLPVDPSTPIITMKYVGGVTQIPRQNVYPSLTVRSDGSVTITDTLGRAKPVEASISEDEVQELLRFSLKEQEFLEFTAGNALQDIAVESAQCGRSVRVKEDEGTTIIHIRTADLDHEASFNSLGFFAEAYPGIKSLGQLWTIEKRLNHFMEEVKAGGKKAVETAAEQASAFAKRQKESITFQVEDLQRTVMTADGRQTMEFLHKRDDGTSISVDVESKSGAPSAISGKYVSTLPTRPMVACPQAKQSNLPGLSE
jgi:hypothetical protein